MAEIGEKAKKDIKTRADTLKGVQKREFIARVTLKFLDGNARKAEREFGWGRETVTKGIREITTNIRCVDNYRARGNKKTEEKSPKIAQDIFSIFDHEGQIRKEYTHFFPLHKLTARGVMRIMTEHMGYSEETLPSESTISNMLMRLGLRPGKPG